MTIPEDVREALAAATPGPWTLQGGIVVEANPADTSSLAPGFAAEPAPDAMLTDVFGDNWTADAHLIANAPTWLAALCDENDRLREALERIARSKDGYYGPIARATLMESNE